MLEEYVDWLIIYFKLPWAFNMLKNIIIKSCWTTKTHSCRMEQLNKFQRDVRRRRDGKWIENYLDNILKNFDVIDLTKSIYRAPVQILHNDFTCNEITNHTDGKDPIHILVDGLSQNINLFKDTVQSLEKYINFSDPEIRNYVFNKYPSLLDQTKIHLCVGIRIGEDFSHMKRVTPSSYEKAFKYYINTIKLHEYADKKIYVYVLADVKKDWEVMIESFATIYSDIQINFIQEDDITQFYVGLECNHFILSESTYHMMIALIAYSRDTSEERFWLLTVQIL